MEMTRHVIAFRVTRTSRGFRVNQRDWGAGGAVGGEAS